MPYIKNEDKQRLQHGAAPKTAGELNYAIHLLLDKFILHNNLSYQTCNDIMGALQGVQQEFYRRKVAPYENQKMITNGDIDFYK